MSGTRIPDPNDETKEIQRRAPPHLERLFNISNVDPGEAGIEALSMITAALYFLKVIAAENDDESYMNAMISGYVEACVKNSASF